MLLKYKVALMFLHKCSGLKQQHNGVNLVPGTMLIAAKLGSTKCTIVY